MSTRVQREWENCPKPQGRLRFETCRLLQRARDRSRKPLPRDEGHSGPALELSSQSCKIQDSRVPPPSSCISSLLDCPRANGSMFSQGSGSGPYCAPRLPGRKTGFDPVQLVLALGVRAYSLGVWLVQVCMYGYACVYGWLGRHMCIVRAWSNFPVSQPDGWMKERLGFYLLPLVVPPCGSGSRFGFPRFSVKSSASPACHSMGSSG